MVKLADMQRSFRKAVHGSPLDDTLTAQIISDELTPSIRMQVYQNNYQMGLIDLLHEVFPVSSAFVGDVFLRTAARHYIEDTPLRDVNLEDYGIKFPAFLAAYEHGNNVPYLGDIASLEWAIHALQQSRTLAGRDFECPERPEFQSFYTNPDVRIIVSDYPLLQLWMVGLGQLKPEAVHIGTGGQNVGVYVDGNEIKMNTISDDELVAFEELKSSKNSQNEIGETHLLSLFDKKLLFKFDD